MSTNRAPPLSSAPSSHDISTPVSAWWVVLNLFQAAFLVVWTSFWISTALVVLAVTFQREWALALARKAWGPGIMRAAGAHLDVTGLDGLDPDQPYVFVSNHQSLIDTAVGFTAMGRNVRFVAKRELAVVPFIGWYVWAMGMVFVDRKNVERAIESLDKAAETIREGASVIGFPEGTRSRDGLIQPFKKGLFLLAINAGVPVVPVGIKGADEVVPCDGMRVRPGVIHVNVGKPISTEGMTQEDRDTLIRSVHDAVIDLNVERGGPGGPREPAVAVSKKRPAA